jgi:hypothetical protein
MRSPSGLSPPGCTAGEVLNLRQTPRSRRRLKLDRRARRSWGEDGATSPGRASTSRPATVRRVQRPLKFTRAPALWQS